MEIPGKQKTTLTIGGRHEDVVEYMPPIVSVWVFLHPECWSVTGSLPALSVAFKLGSVLSVYLGSVGAPVFLVRNS